MLRSMRAGAGEEMEVAKREKEREGEKDWQKERQRERKLNMERGLGEAVVEGFGAVVYQMEWVEDEMGAYREQDGGYDSKPTRPWKISCCQEVFGLMLHVDYGLPAYPLGELVGWRMFESFADLLTTAAWQWRRGEAVPAKHDWELLGSVLWYISNTLWGLTVWDVAVLFYLYHTHRTAVAEADRAKGWTGYTGVLQEMMAEVPTRGTGRLERKLSLDVHYLIPRCVDGWERQAELAGMAVDVARRYGCQLAPPTIPEASRWWKWYDALVGLIPSRQRLPDEERGEVQEKLLEGGGSSRGREGQPWRHQDQQR